MRRPLFGFRFTAVGLTFALAMGVSHSVAKAANFDQVCATAPAGASQAAGSQALSADPSTLPGVLKAARSGDVIVLGDGDYGHVALSGTNAGFVTVMASPGGGAVLSSLTVAGSHWVVKGLTIDGASGPGAVPPPTPAGKWPSHPWLVRIQGGDNVIMDGDVVTSRPGPFPWSEESQGVDDPAPLSSGILATNAACVTLSNNKISNVFMGIGIEGDQIGGHGKYYRVIGNRIDNFAGDGVDHSVSDAIIAQNIITNGHDICKNLCIHTDGIQGFNFRDQSGITNDDVVIDSNIIFQRTDRTLEVPADDLHGITIFDGFWKDVSVTNNVIVTATWHGITINGVDGLIVANNTVLASSDRQTWISAGGTTHQGGVSRAVIVRNNIATKILIPKVPPIDMKVDHNLEVNDPRSVFVEFDAAKAQYDLHPRKGTAAVGRGAPDGAPLVDIEGKPRAAPIDLGAYQHRR